MVPLPMGNPRSTIVNIIHHIHSLFDFLMDPPELYCSSPEVE